MEYQDQSAASLILAVTMDAVDWEQFTVLKDGELRGGPARVRAAIIGESHLLEVRTQEGRILSEVFACVRPELARPAYFQDVLPRLPETIGISRHEFGGHILYRCHPRLTTWRYGNIRAEALQHEGRATDHGMLLSFRFPSKNRMQGAITVVRASWADRALRVSTAHCYPNEDRAATTDSLIIIPEGETR